MPLNPPSVNPPSATIAGVGDLVPWILSELRRLGYPEKGDPGPAGSNRLYIQQSQPSEPPPWVWYETDGAGELVTIWVNT